MCVGSNNRLLGCLGCLSDRTQRWIPSARTSLEAGVTSPTGTISIKIWISEWMYSKNKLYQSEPSFSLFSYCTTGHSVLETIKTNLRVHITEI